MAQQKRPNNGKKPNRANGNGQRNAASGRRPAPQSGRPGQSSGQKKPRPAGTDPRNRNPRKPGEKQPVNPVYKDPREAIKRVPAFGDEENLLASEETIREVGAEKETGRVNETRPASNDAKNKPSEKGNRFRKKQADKKDLKGKKETAEDSDESSENIAAAPVLEVADANDERRKHMTKMRRREALTASFNAFLCVLILIGVMVIAVLYVIDYVAAKPTYAFATQGSIEHTIGATALVVRNETVLDSTHTGSLLTQATEGSRVSKGQLLAMVIPDGMDSTVAELRNIEQQIVDRERELMAQGKGIDAKTIFSDIDGEIAPIITMVRQDAILGNLKNMTSYSSSIRVLMEKRDVDLENIDFNDEQLDVLRNNESALKNQLETQAASIYASQPGIVSYKLDGMENAVSYTLLMSTMDNQLASMLEGSNSIITGDLDVKASEPVLRIVQNDVQYFACEIKGASMTEFELESVHVIRIPSEGISIPDCKVIRSMATEEGVLVVFETNNQVERLLDRRTIDIEIVQTKTTGIRVPISSLVDPDYERGIATIYVNESGYAKGYTVTISDYDREYAIIAPMEGQTKPDTSTIVITNPNTVKEGDKVEK